MHLKETKVGEYRGVPFMNGHVDFEAIIGKAWELGVRRYVTEMWDNGQADWKEHIKFANKKHQRNFKQADIKKIMFDDLKRKVYDANIALTKIILVLYTCGNVSGFDYNTMNPSYMVADLDGTS